MSFPLVPNEAERLQALRDLRLLDTVPEAEFDAVCRTAQRLFSVPIVLVSLIDEDRQWFKARCGLEANSTPRAIAFCNHTILADEVAVVEDATQDERFNTNPLVTGDLGIRFYAGAPLVLRPGIQVGTLCIIDTAPRSFPPEQQSALRDLAQIVVTYLRLHKAKIDASDEALVRRSNEALIIEQKAEIETHAAEVAARQGLLRTTLENMDQGLIMVDPSGVVQVCNQRAIDLLGLPPEMMAAKPTFEAVRQYQVEHEEFAKLEPSLATVVKTLGAIIPDYCYERERPNGTVLEVRTVPLKEGGIVRTFTDITTQKRAQEALAGSERRFKVITDTMPQMVWSARPDGFHDFYNRRWYEFTGVPEGSTDGEAWNGVLHPGDQEQARSKWQRSLATGEPYETEYRLRHYSGEYRWTLGRALPIRDEQGGIERWFGTCTDIHDAKCAEAALVASEGRYRALAEASAVIVWRAAPDGSITESWGWEAFCGQGPDSHLGHGWLDAVHPDDRGDVVSVWQEHLANPRLCLNEYRVRCLDGEYRWVLARAVPLLGANGQVQEWVGTVTDTHERRLADERLRLSEGRYRALIEASAVVVWVAAPDGAMREGLGWTELTGRPASDYAGLRWLKTVHPDDQERVRGVWDAALRDGAVAVAEFRVRVVDGGYRWVRARGVPIKEAGAIREWVGTITDVHERKTTEAVVRESEERYRAFIETSATIVWRADPSGAPIEASAVSGPLLEYDGTPEGFEATIHPDDLAASRAAWEHALATGGPLDVVERKLAKGGGYRWVHVRGQALRNQDGSVREWVGVVTDIHERTQAVEALREGEERLRLALQATGLGIWDIDLRTGQRNWSSEILEVLGLPVRTPPDRAGFYEQVHPEDRARVELELYPDLGRGAPSRTTTFRIIRADNGDERWVETSGCTLHDETGEPVRMLGTIQDITARKQAENALREGEERLRLALQAGRMFAWERDLNSDFVTRSENARDLVGLGSGPAAEFAARIHPDDQERASSVLLGVWGSTSDENEIRYVRPDGQVVWLMARSVEIREGGRPTRLIGVTFDITDRKAAEEDLWRLANQDSLTGLPNRAMFHRRLEEALSGAQEHGTSVSLLLIDLDGFKDVNDTLGHDAGDALLVETAKRLGEFAREGDTVARLGGDEFAVILVAPYDLTDAASLAEHIIAQLAAPFTYGDRIVPSRASAGVAGFPTHHHTPSDLLKDADLALYRAKAQGRNRVVTYAPEMREATERRVTIAREVQEAIRKGQIVPFYQPKVSFTTGGIVGFEALARWQHPTQGVLTPGYFGSVFEDPELAVAIGESLVDQVATDIRAWLDRGLDCGRVAVNFSSAEFADPFLAVNTLRLLRDAGVPLEHFEVEVTETVLMNRGADYVGSILKQFHESGVRIALDDFGTGFASLTHLKQFPVDHIKVDQSFVRDLEHDRDDAAIVAAVIGLGRSLGVEVTAEGVETAGQAGQLQQMGCTNAQGYLYAKPMVGSRVPWLLETWVNPFRAPQLAQAGS